MPKKTKPNAATAETKAALPTDPKKDAPNGFPTPLDATRLGVEDWMNGSCSLKILEKWKEMAHDEKTREGMLDGVCVQSFALILKELMDDVKFPDGGYTETKWAEACSHYFLLLHGLMWNCGKGGIDLCHEIALGSVVANSFASILDSVFRWISETRFEDDTYDRGVAHVNAMIGAMELLSAIAATPKWGTPFAYAYYRSFDAQDLIDGIIHEAKCLVHQSKRADDEMWRGDVTVGKAKHLGCAALFTIADILCWTRTRPDESREHDDIYEAICALVDGGMVELAINLQKTVLERIPVEGQKRASSPFAYDRTNVLFWEAFAACLIPGLKASIDAANFGGKAASPMAEMKKRVCEQLMASPNILDVTIHRLGTTPLPPAPCLYRLMLQLVAIHQMATEHQQQVYLVPTVNAITRESFAERPPEEDRAFAATHRFAGILFAVAGIIPRGHFDVTLLGVEYALGGGILRVVNVEFSRLASEFEEMQKAHEVATFHASSFGISLSKAEMDKFEAGVLATLDFFKIIFGKKFAPGWHAFRANFLVESQILEDMERMKWAVRDCSNKTKVLGMLDEIESMLGNCADTRIYRTHVERRSQFTLERARERIEAAHSRLRKIRTDAGVDEYMLERPREHNCPILAEVMVDPVVAEDGHSYERSAISQWFSKGKKTSPLTNVPIGDKLVKNETLRMMIENFEMEAHKKAMDHASSDGGAEKRKRDEGEGE